MNGQPLILTTPLGQNINVSSALEYYLKLDTPDTYPEGMAPEGWNSATLVCKWVTGAVHLFPFMSFNDILEKIMVHIPVPFFESYAVEATGQFWFDTEKGPNKTIQPTFDFFAVIEGSRARNLYKEKPESIKWPLATKIDYLKEHDEIKPDIMFVKGVPYSSLVRLQYRLGVRFFQSFEHVLEMIEAVNPEVVESHPQRQYIINHIQAPFTAQKKKERQQEAAKVRQMKENAKNAGLYIPGKQK